MLDQASEANPLKTLLAGCQCHLLVPQAVRKLLEGNGMAPPIENDKRRFPRFRIRAWLPLDYQTTFPVFPRAAESHAVILTGLSRGGLSFLHSDQLFPKEQLSIMLQNGTRRTIEVARCQWLGRRCHLIGAQFK